jgi:DNA-binding transcriptional LysR family regulator
LTRQLNSLEQQLGTLLLNRSTRSISLTPAGRGYYEDARRILDELDHADRAVSEAGKQPGGVLRVTAPVAFARLHIAPALPGYLRSFPDVRLEFQLNDNVLNLVDERLDVAIRLAHLPDSALVARRLAHHRRIVCASPGYVQERGIPAQPEALGDHNCLLFDYGSGEDLWTFSQGSRTIRAPVRGNLRASGSEILREAALGGAGIILLPTWLVGATLPKGACCRCWTSGRQRSARKRA